MKPSQIAHSLRLLHKVKQPAFIWGPPGVGKSDVVAQVATDLKIELRDVRLNLLDPVDLKGFPMINKNKTQMTWLPADFLPTEGAGILFLDEMNSAPPSVQAAAYQLVLNRRIGDYELPKDWSIFAAGNRETDRSVVSRMPSALANRLVHMDFEIFLDDWCDWALENGVTPNLLGFMRFRPNLLHAFNPNDRAFPTPRSWMFVNKLMNSQLHPDTEFELIKGAVGEGAAGEFFAFIKLARDLPTPEEILKDPEKTKVPDSPATLYALCTSLSMHTKVTTFAKLMKYIERMPVEFQVIYIRDTSRIEKGIINTETFCQWSVKNINVLK